MVLRLPQEKLEEAALASGDLARAELESQKRVRILSGRAAARKQSGAARSLIHAPHL